MKQPPTLFLVSFVLMFALIGCRDKPSKATDSEADRITKLSQGKASTWASMPEKDRDLVCQVYARSYIKTSGSKKRTEELAHLACRVCVDGVTSKGTANDKDLAEIAFLCLSKTDK